MTVTMTEPTTKTKGKNQTQTHTEQELIFLRAALHKAADKVESAIGANRAAGASGPAEKLQERHEALVGVEGEEGGSTSDRLKQAIEQAGDDRDKNATFSFVGFEAKAIEIGLPLLARRLRSMEGEMKSIGRDDVGEWCREMSEHCEGALKGMYADQMALL